MRVIIGIKTRKNREKPCFLLQGDQKEGLPSSLSLSIFS